MYLNRKIWLIAFFAILVAILIVCIVSPWVRDYRLASNCDLNRDGKINISLPISNQECDQAFVDIRKQTFAPTYLFKSSQAIQEEIRDAINKRVNGSYSFGTD